VQLECKKYFESIFESINARKATPAPYRLGKVSQTAYKAMADSRQKRSQRTSLKKEKCDQQFFCKVPRSLIGEQMVCHI
jgi:hypothetical protein